MLSYQHEYHAGNHADILKHTCLALILSSLNKKEKPYTVIDMHSGAGRFSLDDERALKTGEAKEGIQKLYRFYSRTSAPFPQGLELYLKAQKPYVENKMYAGSPEVERIFMRSQDTLHLIEKHPQAVESLESNMKKRIELGESAKDSFVKVNIHKGDSYTTLNSLVPPVFKRGLILCDPSYEDGSDYVKVTESLINARRKWNTSIIALWYPLLARRKNETAQMLTALEDAGKLGTTPCESIKVELIVRDPEEMKEDDGAHLYGSGMFIMNPTWQLKEELEKSAEFVKKIMDVL